MMDKIKTKNTTFGVLRKNMQDLKIFIKTEKTKNLRKIKQKPTSTICEL